MRKRCPDSKALVSAFFGDMTQEKKAKLIEHTFQCPPCELRFKALRKIRLELEDKVNSIPSRALTEEETNTLCKLAEERLSEMGDRHEIIKPRFLGRFRFVYVAAAVVLVVGIATVIFSDRIFSSRFMSRSSDGGTLRLLEPIGKLPSPPVHFSWTAFPDADIYLIQIIDENLSIILMKDVFVPEYTLPTRLSPIYNRAPITSFKSID
jgi:hypothetical protein